MARGVLLWNIDACVHDYRPSVSQTTNPSIFGVIQSTFFHGSVQVQERSQWLYKRSKRWRTNKTGAYHYRPNELSSEAQTASSFNFPLTQPTSTLSLLKVSDRLIYASLIACFIIIIFVQWKLIEKLSKRSLYNISTRREIAKKNKQAANSVNSVSFCLKDKMMIPLIMLVSKS